MEALQRRMIEEDMVQYKLFLIQPSSSSSQKTEERLTHLVEEILAKVAPLLIQYIWQHQPFNLKYHPEKGGIPAHIGGSTQFGDNVEDEWFIVYLLLQITEAFPELAARVEDNDGEFLLIEAADYLPKWLNPDTSENRVFLYKGELHILPCPSKSTSVGFSKDVVPSVAQALELLYTHPEVCRASSKISLALKKRLEGYPGKIKSGLHRAHCFIPAGIATVLAQRPDLIAPAVSAFYLRDPVDLQACRTFKTFPPDTRVLTLVTFTRCLYAQLQQQQFTPDRRSGFTLPSRSHSQYKAHELGMKLAHGFEILCSRCRLPSSEPNAPVSCNPQWKGFMESLNRNGYFHGELEGSARYRELTRSAENFFKQSVASKSSALSPGEEVLQLLHSCEPFNLEEMKKNESQLPQEDSDLIYLGLHCHTDRLFHFYSRSSATQPFTIDPDSMANALGRLLGMKLANSEICGMNLPQLKKKSLMNLSFLFFLGGKDEELDSDDLDDSDDDNDDEEEEVEEKEDGFCGQAAMKGTETLDSLKRYMDQMDEELMKTNVGQSFKRTVNSRNTDNKLEEKEEEIQPLDVDVNLVTNLLESLSCQAGLAGPASNLLQSLGIHLPPNSDPA
uniref:Ecdysoneless homolog (Drosophila) n=1 Tax=Oreochromis niloticus TaxID=8128 RepID=A0A669CCF3_ORENI